MNGNLSLKDRLLHFDKSALAEAELTGASDPDGASDTLWHFISTIADSSPHVPSGLVDGALLLLFKIKGRDYMEQFIINSLGALSEECRGELLYSGISNPAVFSNDYCRELFRQTKDVAARRTIASSVYSTTTERHFPIDILAEMLQTIGEYGDPERDDELTKYVARLLGDLPRLERN